MSTLARVRTISWIIAGILFLLPFHALLTTWLGSNTGHLDLIRIWKELIITVLIPLVALMAARDTKLRSYLRSWRLLWLIAIFALIQIVWGVWAYHSHKVTSVALIYAWIINLRYFVFFAVCAAVASKDDLLVRIWPKILLIPASLVLFFGVAQRFFLPYDFLRHFGYGPKTIPAYQTVDSSLDYRRIQSTLRGANPLGAYLIPIVIVAITTLKKQKRLLGFVLFFCALILFYSYSRSAWIGLGASLIYLAWLGLNGQRLKLVAAASALVIAIAVAGAVLAKSQSLQDTLFHTSASSKSAQSSNAQRVTAEKAAIKDVYHHPFGQGPGTAGPASFRNNNQPKIAENYYLQIAQEVGIIGLIFWLAITALVASSLYKLRAQPLAQILLASLIGISLVNLVSHAWTDDTLSLLWWGLAGIALRPVILKSKPAK